VPSVAAVERLAGTCPVGKLCFQRTNFNMATLASELGEISHCSALLRRARRQGLDSTAKLVGLAVARGCRHYAPAYPPLKSDPGFATISNEELVALLLLGENEFDPIAIRCAAQLAGSCDTGKLVQIAIRERIGRTLSYIADAGMAHDAVSEDFWIQLKAQLGDQDPVIEGVLPHWSRFVSQTGLTRNGGGSVTWLHCQ
jgi:hypothetical protein